MEQLNNNLENLQGMTPEYINAIEVYCNGILKMFNNNPTVKLNLFQQLKKHFTGLEYRKLKNGISGSVSSLSSCISLSSDLEEWNYINTFLHELTHQLAKNEYIDEYIQVYVYNLGLKMSNDDVMDSLFRPCSSWAIDGNNYVFDRGSAMMLLDEWLTEWLANKFSGLKNVELITDENGNFRIKTSHGYDGSNIMNLMELTFGEAQLTDLLLGLSLTEDERKCVIPLKGFQKICNEFSSDLLSKEEKDELINSSKYIKNPNLPIYISFLISKYNGEKSQEQSNEYLGKIMDILLRVYSNKFGNAVEKISTNEDVINAFNQLSIVQKSIMWNYDMEKMFSNEYYRKYVEMVKILKDKCLKSNIDIDLSSLEKTPSEMFEYFSNLEQQYGHIQKIGLAETNNHRK